MRGDVHISIDDVTNALKRLSIRNYNSLYEDKFFNYLYLLNRLLGAKITLYVLYQSDNWTLADIPEKFKGDFMKASNWMKIGFHAVSEEQNQSNVLVNFEDQYKLTIQQINRFAGEQSVAKILRLHYWFYPPEYTDVLKRSKVIGILTKSDCEANEIDGIPAYRTQIRVEQELHVGRKIFEYRKTTEPLVVFTHEWALNRINKVKLALAILLIRLCGYKFICE